MSHENLKERTMAFALRVLEVVDAMPDGPKGWAVAYETQYCLTKWAPRKPAASPFPPPTGPFARSGPAGRATAARAGPAAKAACPDHPAALI